MMKRLSLLFLSVAFSAVGYSQVFPGLIVAHKKQLLASGIKIPLPTWLPEGFSVDTFEIKTGKNIEIQDQVLYVQYTKRINDSTWQSIIVEAGFDGLAHLGYEREKIQSAIGEIDMYYQPYEKVENVKKEKLAHIVNTEWFKVNNISFHVINIITGGEFEVMGDEDEQEDKYKYVPVSKDDFKKILQSLQVLK